MKTFKLKLFWIIDCIKDMTLYSYEDWKDKFYYKLIDNLNSDLKYWSDVIKEIDDYTIQERKFIIGE